jgi:hypothetical protein
LAAFDSSFDLCIFVSHQIEITRYLLSAGAAYVGSFVNLMRDNGFWSAPRGQGLLDGGKFLLPYALP